MKTTYETLNSMTTETSVPHYSKELVPHTLPANQLPDGDTYLDEAKLLAWAKDNGCLLSALQLGVQQRIIKMRSVFKSVKKDDTWSPEYGQKNLDASTWPVQKKPAGKQTKEQTVKEFLASMTPAERLEWLEANMS